jgi:hypothetical protein
MLLTNNRCRAGTTGVSFKASYLILLVIAAAMLGACSFLGTAAHHGRLRLGATYKQVMASVGSPAVWGRASKDPFLSASFPKPGYIINCKSCQFGVDPLLAEGPIVWVYPRDGDHWLSREGSLLFFFENGTLVRIETGRVTGSSS